MPYSLLEYMCILTINLSEYINVNDNMADIEQFIPGINQQ